MNGRRRLAAAGRGQRGATLMVALIMLAVITFVVVNAFTMSNSNLKAVANMQAREESTAAANQALERLIGTPFHQARTAQTWNVDINKDGTSDYAVTTAIPVCMRATQATAGHPSDVELGSGMSTGAFWNVDWDLEATVRDAASGASVVVHQGVRKYLSQAEKDTVCP